MQYSAFMSTKSMNSVTNESSLEQVRDILFGETQRSLGKDLSSLEARVVALEQRSEHLEKELAAAKEDLDSKIRMEAQRQDKALHSEANRISKSVAFEVSRLDTQHAENVNTAAGQRLRDKSKLAALLVALAQQLEAE